ncbi:MAG: Bug family tripartite tricarboxylate transporter substrate binding protein [Burkholderiales bacterium]
MNAFFIALLPAIFVASWSAPIPALGQSFPSKTIRILVPYDPGGAVDVTARMLQPRLSASLGQQVIVENRPGAAGKVGAEVVSRAEPDGHLVLYTAGGTFITWQSNPASPEAVRRLTPITSAVTSVGAIAARRELPVNSMGELLELAKRNPGKLSYGSSGIGSFQHLIGERLKLEGIDLLHIPYKGFPAAMTALASGQIDLAITNLATSLPLLKDGKVKVLALTQSSRFDATPSIPAITEAMPGLELPAPWYGFWGPPQLPRAIVSRLSGDIAKALVAPEVKAKFTELSMVAIVTTPEQFQTMVRDTDTVYQRIIKAGNIQLD